MTNEEILGGLKSAIDRGESLKKAMMTFFNAGYKREEIEEAARNLTAQTSQPVTAPVTPSQPVAVKKPLFAPLKPANPIPQKKPEPLPVQKMPEPIAPAKMPEPVQYQQPAPVVKQKVSNYGEDAKGKTLIFILVGILIFLLGTLIAIFIFKNELINFFSSFFS